MAKYQRILEPVITKNKEKFNVGDIVRLRQEALRYLLDLLDGMREGIYNPDEVDKIIVKTCGLTYPILDELRSHNYGFIVYRLYADGYYCETACLNKLAINLIEKYPKDGVDTVFDVGDEVRYSSEYRAFCSRFTLRYGSGVGDYNTISEMTLPKLLFATHKVANHQKGSGRRDGNLHVKTSDGGYYFYGDWCFVKATTKPAPKTTKGYTLRDEPDPDFFDEIDAELGINNVEFDEDEGKITCKMDIKVPLPMGYDLDGLIKISYNHEGVLAFELHFEDESAQKMLEELIDSLVKTRIEPRKE